MQDPGKKTQFCDKKERKRERETYSSCHEVETEDALSPEKCIDMTTRRLREGMSAIGAFYLSFHVTWLVSLPLSLQHLS